MNLLLQMTQNAKAFLEDLISMCPDGIIGIDRSGMVTIFNSAASKLTGYPIEDVINKKHISEIYGSLNKARKIKAAILDEGSGGSGRLEHFETIIKNRTGKSVPISLSAVLLEKEGKEIGSVGFFHDMTQRKEMEKKLRTLSNTDGLTGLYNQRHFYECLSDEIARARRYQRPMSLICFDLDKFKDCNDQLGHLEGDNILRMTGSILRSITRRSDLAFRYGGDEFFILLPETDLEKAKITADKIRKEFNRRWPYPAAGQTSNIPAVSLSIGVVQRKAETEPEPLIKRADLAMYAAKEAGGNRITAHGTIGEQA